MFVVVLNQVLHIIKIEKKTKSSGMKLYKKALMEPGNCFLNMKKVNVCGFKKAIKAKFIAPDYLWCFFVKTLSIKKSSIDPLKLKL